MYFPQRKFRALSVVLSVNTICLHRCLFGGLFLYYYMWHASVLFKMKDKGARVLD